MWLLDALRASRVLDPAALAAADATTGLTALDAALLATGPAAAAAARRLLEAGAPVAARCQARFVVLATAAVAGDRSVLHRYAAHPTCAAALACVVFGDGRVVGFSFFLSYQRGVGTRTRPAARS